MLEQTHDGFTAEFGIFRRQRGAYLYLLSPDPSLKEVASVCGSLFQETSRPSRPPPTWMVQVTRVTLGRLRLAEIVRKF
jgi:hypothetical protein